MWIHGLPNGFRDNGHEVVVSGPLQEDKMEETIKIFKPDLIITMGWGPENTSVKKQNWIKQQTLNANVPHIYWATEDPTSTEIFSLPYIQRTQPDCIFTICREKVDFYRGLGFKAFHLDFGHHPSVHTPVAKQKDYYSPVAVVANGYPKKMGYLSNHYRHQSMRELIKPLIEKNIQTFFYGRGWEEMGSILGVDIPKDWIKGYIDYKEARRVYSSADIIIGLQNLPTQLTQRTYEILACGGLFLTNNTPEILKKFKPGKELVVSSSPEETIRLIEYYLEKPEERKQIKNRAVDAVRHQSYQERAKYIVDLLNRYNVFDVGRKESIEIKLERKIFEKDGASFYKICNGDTLSSIAKAFSTSVEYLKRINHLETDMIYAGHTLRITESNKLSNLEMPSLVTESTLYTICAGDTLSSIAKKFHVSINDIKNINNLKDDLIYVGQLIKINKLPHQSIKPYACLITKGIKMENVVSLTYDGGGSVEHTQNVLDVLKKHNVQTTIFLTGKWVEEYPNLAKRILEDGHELGNHSYNHLDLTKIPYTEIVKEIRDTEEVFERVLGQKGAPIFRPPFGYWNREVLEAAREAGYLYTINWSIDSLDWQSGSKDSIVQRVKEKYSNRDIVLFHLNGNHTANVTQELINFFKEKEYSLKKVSNLLFNSKEL